MILSTGGGVTAPGGSAPDEGGGAWSRGMPGLGGRLVWELPGLGGAWSGGTWWRPPGMATAAGGMHPTGMHSCFSRFSQ